MTPTSHADSSATTTKVNLTIPAELNYQLIFRKASGLPISVTEPPGVGFYVVSDLRSWLNHAARLFKAFGAARSLRTLAKIFRDQIFYFVASERDGICHTGWVTFSRCNHYPVENNAAVIGPIWSSEAVRGQGVATFATQSIVNELLNRRWNILYIDTANSNIPCLRMIEKCAFGQPVSCHLRPQDNGSIGKIDRSLQASYNVKMYTFDHKGLPCPPP